MKPWSYDEIEERMSLRDQYLTQFGKRRSGLPAYLASYFERVDPDKIGELMAAKRKSDVCVLCIHLYYRQKIEGHWQIM